MTYKKDKSFWKKPFRLIQPNLRKIDAVTINVKDIVEEVQNYGANAMIVNGGGIIAWYPTDNPYQQVNDFMEGDILHDFIETAHSKGIKVLVRMDISKSFQHVLEQHPDWFRKDINGNVKKHWEMLMTCPTGPYWEENSFKVIKELLEKYEIDGIFFNAYNYFICHCTRCRHLFKKVTGYDLPELEDWSEPEWRAFVNFRYVTHADYTKRLSNFIEDISPGTILTVDTNITSDGYKGIRDSGWETSLIAEGTGCITSEAFNFFDRPFPRWTYWAGEEVKIGNHFNQTMIILNYSYSIFSRRSAQPPLQIGYDLMQIAANGGSPSIALSGTFKQDDRKSLPMIKEILRFLEENEKEYQHSKPIEELAIVYSQQTADYYGADEASNWQKHYRGVYECLVESHLQFTVLHEKALNTVDLDTFKCIILPNTAIISKDAAEKIDNYVSKGGHIIATYETGFYDEGGFQLSENSLKCLNRKLKAREATEGSYLKIHNKKLFPYFNEIDLVMLLGSFILTEPIRKQVKGMITDLTMIPAIKNTTPEYAYWTQENIEPGMIKHDYGEGTTTYLPWCIDRMYNQYGINEYKYLLLNLIEQVLPTRVLSTNAPSTVEITVAKRESGGYLIHLLNATGQQGKPYSEIIHLSNINIEINKKVSRAYSLKEQKDYSITQNERGIDIAVPRLGLYDVLIVS